MAEQKTQNFIRRMKDRLVLLVNTENAQSFFRVDFKGSMVEVRWLSGLSSPKVGLGKSRVLWPTEWEHP